MAAFSVLMAGMKDWGKLPIQIIMANRGMMTAHSRGVRSGTCCATESETFPKNTRW
jgi:hypothetical protein